MATSQPPLRAILDAKGTFKRSARRLPPRMKEELGLVVEELLEGELSPGRNCEQLTNMPGVYSVRLNQSYRFVFEVTDGIADPLAVGPHDQAYADAIRRYRRRSN